MFSMTYDILPLQLRPSFVESFSLVALKSLFFDGLFHLQITLLCSCRVTLPHYSFEMTITGTPTSIIVEAKLGFRAVWNLEDSLDVRSTAGKIHHLTVYIYCYSHVSFFSDRLKSTSVTAASYVDSVETLMATRRISWLKVRSLKCCGLNVLTLINTRKQGLW